MKARSSIPSFTLILALALSAVQIAAAADDSSVIRLTLLNTGRDPDASGALLSTLKSKSSLVSVRAAGFMPGRSYELVVGTVAEATVVADSRGRINTTFTTRPRKNGPVLDFDPRGQLVALNDGTANVLEAVVSGSNEPAGIMVDERARLGRLVGSGEATTRYRVLGDGQRTFVVKIERVEPGEWSLFVNGIFRGAIQVSSRQTTAVFDSTPAGPTRRLLDFDPRGQVVDIALGTNLVFSGKLEAKADQVNVATPSLAVGYIPSTGADPDGTARTKLRVEPDARRKFSVEVEDLPVGLYDFLVNGMVQGSIHVAAGINGTEGELEFSNRNNDDGELPLAFDPATSTFAIQTGGIIYFQGALAAASAGGTVTNDAPTFLEEKLTSTGLDPDASGDAKFEIDDRGRRKFSVEIEDVAAGSYELWVGGIQRGTIAAALATTKVKGEVEFENDDDGSHLLLDFDPRGQRIEVKGLVGVLFSHEFGAGSTGETNSVLIPVRIEVPLFNLGVSPKASARANFRRDDRGRRKFEVEIEDAPVGSYALRVGDSQVGTITVTTSVSGTRGQIEFEDDDDGTHPALTFDPRGQVITVSRDSVDYFQRVFPESN